MGNRDRRKKEIVLFVLYLLAGIGAFALLYHMEYRAYTENVNRKAAAIIEAVSECYPEVSEQELVELLSENNRTGDAVLLHYGIDAAKDSLILENDALSRKYLLAKTALIAVLLIVPFGAFLLLEKRKKREIDEITGYIEAINRGNYNLKIDNNVEDGMSILKNEVYKSTVMLREAAENSKKDKLLLKDSLSDISHQLKTPITSLMINLDNLEDLAEHPCDNSETERELRARFVKNARREVMKISFLVQTLLKLSKLDANTITFLPKENRVRDLIDQAMNNVSSLADLLGITVTIECLRDDGNLLRCDETWAVEALTNVLKNAVEHAASSVVVEYDCCELYQKIVIRNDGAPISKKDLGHIFERFYKGANAKKDSVGIGLAMAKAIVEQDGGYILAELNENDPNGGAAFTIRY